jgi:formiminoglutamase
MKSNFNTFEFLPNSNKKLNQIISKRSGESKLGENFCANYNSSTCKYVILGISEDIGPQSNYGLPGSNKAFNAFLTRFINTQSNRFLSGNEICILGEIIQTSPFETIEKGRKQIEELDDFVQKIIQPIFQAKKIPIIIGGGHNNAYPLIKSASISIKNKIQVINLDPHADCRALEGRHSGNPFSYAHKNEYLSNYSVLGLHQQYNNENLYQYLDENHFFYTFFEDYLDQKRDLKKDIQTIINNTNDTKIGVELDLDSIKMIPSSAFSPSGFTIEEARIYLRELAKQNNICYLHLPEGAPQSEIEDKTVGKTLSYLVLDFIKENKNLK